ncbi:unnamed protein product [Staurois parvus]|uniref:Uncharacterized protein n=1 Tax=Staurois parvus TaxID=386267 RepID=A0ABN9EED5_9NEOB|nr:unnamed protein product [Staurois parvus]
MRGSQGVQRSYRWCAVSLGHSGSPINEKMLARSCDQLCPITADHIPSSATCQCPSVPAVSAHPCHLLVPINATFQCPSVPHQCHISVPI